VVYAREGNNKNLYVIDEGIKSDVGWIVCAILIKILIHLKNYY